MNYRLMRGDCLKRMNEIASGSVDLILCDLPYGTTNCSWDIVIPYEPLWTAYKRILKNGGAVLLFGSEPFSTALRQSNFSWYKYDLYWVKNKVTGFMDANRKPLKNIELVSVFGEKRIIYNPQGLIRKNAIKKSRPSCSLVKDWNMPVSYKQEYTNYPKSVLFYDSEVNTVHPTQKPTALLQYLIKTYSNKGDLVLDNCMGSGSTGMAAMNTDRRFIGIEQERKYYDIAVKRISRAHDERELALF